MAEGKKLRLVIDLRHVIEFVSKVKFKYEDLRSLSQVLEENHWFFQALRERGCAATKDKRSLVGRPRASDPVQEEAVCFCWLPSV